MQRLSQALLKRAYFCNSLKSQLLTEAQKHSEQTHLSLLRSCSPSLGRPTSKAQSPLTRQAAVPKGQARNCGALSRSVSVKRHEGRGIRPHVGAVTAPNLGPGPFSKSIAFFQVSVDKHKLGEVWKPKRLGLTPFPRPWTSQGPPGEQQVGAALRPEGCHEARVKQPGRCPLCTWDRGGANTWGLRHYWWLRETPLLLELQEQSGTPSRKCRHCRNGRSAQGSRFTARSHRRFWVHTYTHHVLSLYLWSNYRWSQRLGCCLPGLGGGGSKDKNKLDGPGGTAGLYRPQRQRRPRGLQLCFSSHTASGSLTAST